MSLSRIVREMKKRNISKKGVGKKSIHTNKKEDKIISNEPKENVTIQKSIDFDKLYNQLIQDSFVIVDGHAIVRTYDGSNIFYRQEETNKMINAPCTFDNLKIAALSFIK